MILLCGVEVALDDVEVVLLQTGGWNGKNDGNITKNIRQGNGANSSCNEGLCYAYGGEAGDDFSLH